MSVISWFQCAIKATLLLRLSLRHLKGHFIPILLGFPNFSTALRIFLLVGRNLTKIESLRRLSNFTSFNSGKGTHLVIFCCFKLTLDVFWKQAIPHSCLLHSVVNVENSNWITFYQVSLKHTVL